MYGQVVGSLDKKYNLTVLCIFPDIAHGKYCISSLVAVLLVTFSVKNVTEKNNSWGHNPHNNWSPLQKYFGGAITV